MCSTAHIQYEQATGRDRLSGSGNWAFDDDSHGIGTGPKFAPVGRTVPQLARLALLLAISSVSSGPDPWSGTQQQRCQLTMSSTFQTSTRRRITPLEARSLALEILHRAEAGRAASAEAEAKRGIDWEEIS